MLPDNKFQPVIDYTTVQYLRIITAVFLCEGGRRNIVVAFAEQSLQGAETKALKEQAVAIDEASLGIDVGTQSVKARMYDAEQRHVLDIRSAAVDLISEADGTREHLAQWWLAALEQCLAGFDKRAKAGVQAIGVSGQQHGFVPLGADDQVLAPVKLWCDTSTTAECLQITADFGGQDRCVREVGHPILPGYTACKVR